MAADLLTTLLGGFLLQSVPGQALMGIAGNLTSSAIEQFGANTVEQLRLKRNHDLEKLVAESLKGSINKAALATRCGTPIWQNSTEDCIKALQTSLTNHLGSNTSEQQESNWIDLYQSVLTGQPDVIAQAALELLRTHTTRALEDEIKDYGATWDDFLVDASRFFFEKFCENFKDEKHFARGRLAFERDLAWSMRHGIDVLLTQTSENTEALSQLNSGLESVEKGQKELGEWYGKLFDLSANTHEVSTKNLRVSEATHELVTTIAEKLTVLAPDALTASELVEEGIRLDREGNREEAVTILLRALTQAQGDGDHGTAGRASLDGIWILFNLVALERGSEIASSRLHTMETLILAAERAGVSSAKLNLAKAKKAALLGENDQVIILSDSVLSDKESDETTQAESLSLQLQALLFATQLDGALASGANNKSLLTCKDAYLMHSLQCTWLRVLCRSQIATDDDVSYFLTVNAESQDIPVSLRLHNLRLLADDFFRSYNRPEAPSLPIVLLARQQSAGRVSDQFVQVRENLLVALGKEQVASLEAVLMDPKHEFAEDADDLVRGLRLLFNQQLPQTGDRLHQATILLKVGYDLAVSGHLLPEAVEISAQIAEASSLSGDVDTATIFLRNCSDSVQQLATEGGGNKWVQAKLRSQFAHGRTYHRLGYFEHTKNRPSERLLLRSRDEFAAAIRHGEERENELSTESRHLVVEATFLLGDVNRLLGVEVAAAGLFSKVQSMLEGSLRASDMGLRTKCALMEAEARSASGNPYQALQIVNSLLQNDSLNPAVKEEALSFSSHLTENVLPIIDWFHGPHGLRIANSAKRNGLRIAVAEQTKFLLEWHDHDFRGKSDFAHAYDFWGRGGFSRIASAVRARPEEAIAVDAFEAWQLPTIARILCPLFDTVIIKWKGRFDEGSGLDGYPDPAPDYDQFGDFFGGRGLVRASDGLLGYRGQLMPVEVMDFLELQAWPLIKQGRLVVLPAPCVGCTQSAIGWTDDLLTRHFLKGVMNGVAWTKEPGSESADVLDFSRSLIPFIDGVPIGELATVIEDLEEYLSPLRKFVFALAANTPYERTAVVRGAEADFKDACRLLEERLKTLSSTNEGWHVGLTETEASLSAPGDVRPGIDINSEALKAISPVSKELSPWIPFFHLKGLNGYIDWAHRLDNPSKEPGLTPFGAVFHTWLYPGSGGPASVMKMP